MIVSEHIVRFTFPIIFRMLKKLPSKVTMKRWKKNLRTKKKVNVCHMFTTCQFASHTYSIYISSAEILIAEFIWNLIIFREIIVPSMEHLTILNSPITVQPMCSPPGGFLMNLWWIISVPISVVLSISIPDCRVYRKFYPLTFVMCVVWIGICSYIVSWMMTVFGR